MGVTNTISELSNYFYEWHKNKYKEIHEDISGAQDAISEDVDDIKTRLNELILNFNTLLGRFNTLVNGSSSTILNLETDISKNKRDILELQKNQPNLTWQDMTSELEYSNFNSGISREAAFNAGYGAKLYVNEGVRIARLAGVMPYWNDGSVTWRQERAFFINSGQMMSDTGTEMSKVATSKRVYITVPEQYRPYGVLARGAGGNYVTFTIRTDGTLAFAINLKKDICDTASFSIMWNY